MHLLDLAGKVKEGVRKAGLVGYRFNTIGVSDGISMGTEGMSYSLQSREIIADSIETVMSAQWYDANISIPGEDLKTNTPHVSAIPMPPLRLRQEYARMPYRYGTIKSPITCRLRRINKGGHFL